LIWKNSVLGLSGLRVIRELEAIIARRGKH
jgi:hypothetical protein